jgi:hypothetical protein
MSGEARFGVDVSAATQSNESSSHRQDLANQLCLQLNKSLQGFIAEAVDVLSDQVKFILESMDKDHAVDFQIDTAQVSFIITRLFEMKKFNLRKEFRKRMDILKLEINELCFDKERNVILRIDEVLDYKDFLQKSREILRVFDTFCIESQAKIASILNKKKPASTKRAKLVAPALNKLTDFMSDTECMKQAVCLSRRECKYLYDNLKGSDTASGPETEEDDTKEEAHKVLIRSLSDSALANMNVMVSRRGGEEADDDSDELVSFYTESNPGVCFESSQDLFKSSDTECEVLYFLNVS